MDLARVHNEVMHVLRDGELALLLLGLGLFANLVGVRDIHSEEVLFDCVHDLQMMVSECEGLS